jgi:hypothetical protein
MKRMITRLGQGPARAGLSNGAVHFGRRSQWRLVTSLAVPIVVAVAVAVAVPVGSVPVASAASKPPGCTVVPPRLVGTIYGASFGPPKAETNGPVQVCVFSAMAQAITVLVRFEAGESDATFDATRRQFDAHGEHTVTSPGFGRKAYTVVLGSSRAETGTVVVLKGSTELLVSGPGSLAKCEALADKVLPKL